VLEIRNADGIGLGTGGQWPVTPAALWYIDCMFSGHFVLLKLKCSVWETDCSP
jgi:hypothetical protein